MREVRLLKNKVLVRPGEFSPLRGNRLYEVENECKAIGLKFTQGLSIRKQLLVSKTMTKSNKLKSETILDDLTKKFEHQKSSIMEMSRELDLPPVCVIRAILSNRVRHASRESKTGLLKKDIIKAIINDEDPYLMNKFMSRWEVRELRNAKSNDVVGYGQQYSTDEPKMWEDAVCSFLRDHDVKYVTEKDLRLVNATSTPDFLILDDLYINGNLVRWIEVKSFYASGLRQTGFFTNRFLSSQRKRYEYTFGSGAFMFKDGIGEAIHRKYPTTLFLDSGVLNTEYSKFRDR